MNNYGPKKGLELMLNQANYYNQQEQTIEIRFNDAAESIELSFSCLKEVESERIPNGMLAFIGKNGSGKSTAIYELAKLLYANPDQRCRPFTISPRKAHCHPSFIERQTAMKTRI